MNPQYEILAECLLPTHMLEWFELTNVEVKPKEHTGIHPLFKGTGGFFKRSVWRRSL